jgi:hypothetical protein
MKKVKELTRIKYFDWLYGCEVYGTIKFYIEETQMTQDSFLGDRQKILFLQRGS